MGTGRFLLRVLIPDAQFADTDIERAAAGSGVTLDVYRAKRADDVPETVWRGCDGMVVYHEMSIGPAELDRAPKCRIVVRAGVGFDNVDLAACGARGIAVSNTPDYGTTDVADHAIAMLLTLTRGTLSYDETLRGDPVGGWNFRAAPLVRRLRGAIFGVIGLGRIGTATALRARAFGMDVVFYDPYRPDGSDIALGIRRARSLEALLGEADAVSLHTPLTAETTGLIDAKAITAMKPGAILVNTARGPVVDTKAVYDGLKSGHLGAAALDVLPVEPPPLEDRLVAAWRAGEAWLRGRLLLSPHAAFYSAAGSEDLRRKSMETAVAYLQRGELRNCVNSEYLSRAPQRAAQGD
jgi:D-3-phosphoglycerate dehydrogenase/C-terminal binding protein